MIQCFKCKDGSLIKVGISTLKCQNCNFNLDQEDKIFCFHPDLSENHDGMACQIIDEAVKHINNHFWWLARKQVINKIFYDFIGKNEQILEVGAGHGDVTRSLVNSGYSNVAIGDVHLNGLKYAREFGINNLYQFDLMKTPFKNHFDCVALFDVLEHIEDDNIAILKIHKMLKNQGKVVITVPAHEWLWNKFDRLVSHKRRYEIDTLKFKLQKHGFKILRAKSFLISILPLLYIRKILQKDRLQDQSFTNLPNAKEIIPKINFFTNLILKTICSIENRIQFSRMFTNSTFRYGGSIIIVAQKEN